MRPILLNGHGRPLTRIKYNKDGDLLFTISKDPSAAVWWSDTGERLGTYDGHTGALWDVDVSSDSSIVVTGSGDSSAILWNCRTGEILARMPHRGPVHAVSFSEGGKLLFSLSKVIGGTGSYHLRLYELSESLRRLEPLSEDETLLPVQTVDVPAATCGVWMPLNRGIMIGTELGELHIFPFEMGSIDTTPHVIEAHTNKINKIEFNSKKTLFITASKDHTARLFDSKDLMCQKIYNTPAPVNHTAISPLFQHVMIGGGQDAQNVTTTGAREGKFMVRFFHTIYQEEFGRVKGHFGPVNSVAFHPSGRGFASGGEDGYVRIHVFDAPYFKISSSEDRKIDDAVALAQKTE
jgi:translation initiation factor 3 subunit I